MEEADSIHRENLLRNRVNASKVKLDGTSTQVTDDFIIVKLNVLYHREIYARTSCAA